MTIDAISPSSTPVAQVLERDGQPDFHLVDLGNQLSDQLRSEIDGVHDTVGGRIDAAEERIGSELASFQGKLQTRFTGVDARLDKFNAKLEVKLDEIGTRFDTVDSELSRTREEVAGVRAISYKGEYHYRSGSSGGPTAARRRYSPSRRRSVYDDRVSLWNPGELPLGWTEEDLLEAHASAPRNPVIANAFFRAGTVEAWAQPESGTTQPESQPESGTTQPGSLATRVIRQLAGGPLSKSELSARLGQKAVSGRLNKIVRKLLAAERIEYTIPEKPGSRLQRYRVTVQGRSAPESSGTGSAEKVAARSGAVCPQHELKGTVSEAGDIVESAVPVDDWESTRR